MFKGGFMVETALFFLFYSVSVIRIKKGLQMQTFFYVRKIVFKIMR